MYNKHSRPRAVLGCNSADRRGEVMANVSRVILRVLGDKELKGVYLAQAFPISSDSKRLK